MAALTDLIWEKCFLRVRVCNLPRNALTLRSTDRGAAGPSKGRDRVRECQRPDHAATASASARPVGPTGMWAAASMQRLVLLLLVAGVARSQPLHDAAAEGDLDRVVVLLERPGIDVNQANKGTRPAQHCRWGVVPMMPPY